jgi:hypothetical protein
MNAAVAHRFWVVFERDASAAAVNTVPIHEKGRGLDEMVFQRRAFSPFRFSFKEPTPETHFRARLARAACARRAFLSARVTLPDRTRDISWDSLDFFAIMSFLSTYIV